MWPRANTFKHMFRPWPMKPKDIWRYCFFASPFQHPICQLKLNKRISSCPGSWAARLTHLLWAEISVLIQYVIIEVLRKHTSLHVHCTYIYIYIHHSIFPAMSNNQHFGSQKKLHLLLPPLPGPWTPDPNKHKDIWIRSDPKSWNHHDQTCQTTAGEGWINLGNWNEPFLWNSWMESHHSRGLSVI